MIKLIIEVITVQVIKQDLRTGTIMNAVAAGCLRQTACTSSIVNGMHSVKI